jgi:ribosome-associated translation inhibitor RaiA
VEIQFQSHHAVISDRMRERAERAVRKLGARVPNAIDAVIRFEQDGRARRVEIVVRAPGHKRLVAEGTAERFPSALSAAVKRLDAQTREVRRRPARVSAVALLENA